MIMCSMTNRMTIQRRTSRLLETTPAAPTLSPLRQPPQTSLIEVLVTGGTSNTGQVTIAGTIEGSTGSETLTFTGGGYQRTVGGFSVVTGITTSGLSDEATVPDITIEMKDHGGSPVQALYDLISDYPCQVNEHQMAWAAHVGAGRGETGGDWLVIPYAEHFEPRGGDLVTDDLGRRWEIQGRPTRVSGGTVAWMWRAKIKRWERS